MSRLAELFHHDRLSLCDEFSEGPWFVTVLGTVFPVHVCSLEKQKDIVHGEERQRFRNVEIVVSKEIHRLGVNQQQKETDPRKPKIVLARDKKGDPDEVQEDQKKRRKRDLANQPKTDERGDPD
jgi:hypothetical protein